MLNPLQTLRDTEQWHFCINSHVLSNTYYLTAHAASSAEFNRLRFIICLCFLRPISICKDFLGYTLKHKHPNVPLVNTHPLYWFHSPPHSISPVKFQKQEWFREKPTGTCREQTKRRTSTRPTLHFRRCTENRGETKFTAWISTTKKQECLHKTLVDKPQKQTNKKPKPTKTFVLQKSVCYLPLPS